MAEQQLPPDPIRTKSLSGPIAISTLLLLLTTAWAVWDEGVHKRPYIRYQGEWIEKFGAFLDQKRPEIATREQEVQQSAEVQALNEKIAAANAEAAPKVAAVNAELNAIRTKLEAMDFQFRDRKGYTDQQINRIENAHDEDDKQKLRDELREYRAEKFTVEFKDGSKQEYTAEALIDEFLKMKVREGLLQADLGRLNGPTQELQKAKDQYVAKQMRGASTSKIDSMKNELANFRKEIKQIHVPEMRDLVDRCESCHLGIRSPMTIKAEDMGGEKAFTSHPNRELLAIHDPEKFGCSPCHNGNGVAVINEVTAHGRYHHWLWPMPPRENIEAGCVQCHQADLVLDHAPTLSAGKETFRFRGCWACHRYDGFEFESDRLTALQKDKRSLELKEDVAKVRDVDARAAKIAVLGLPDETLGVDAGMRDFLREVLTQSEVLGAERRAAALKAIEAGRVTDDDKTAIAEALTAVEPATAQALAAIETSRSTLQKAEREVLLEIKKVGPSLKEVKMKLDPKWLAPWIQDPASFRPDTKMPTYARIKESPKQAEQIAAFLWSAGVQGPLAKNEQGNAKNGERLVRDRGCLGCHSAKMGEDVIGNTFAAELTRVGEKAKYDYLVRWVSNPKKKTLPYSLDLKRDLTEEDFKKANVPFEFETPNPAWPKEWGTLLTHQMTVMPNLRLSPADARDIATWLMTQKSGDASYPDAAAVTNASQEDIEEGKKLVKHYGCANCHEIAGLEDAEKIGTELTKEGSKPIERLDFGHLTHEAKLSGHENGWYTQKGFFDRKLKDPQIWDQGKELPVVASNNFKPTALKMPNFRFTDEDIRQVSTFLIGSVESGIPANFMNLPQDQRKAIQEGWWIAKKYNCVGCHAFRPGEVPVLWNTPWFRKEGSDMAQWTDANGEVHRGGQDRRPPTLVGEGARVNPQWLAEFLRDPGLGKAGKEKNGLRPYLNVRMPTFDLSEAEIGKLVRFFNAMSHQPMPYMPPEQAPLNADEIAAGRDVLKTCSKCHATGEMTTFSSDINAPDFRFAQARLRPEWTRRLLIAPANMIPGTAMPPWFVEKQGHWVLKDDVQRTVEIKNADHVDLMVRFLSQFNNPGVGKN
jgi:cytochrome c2